LNIGYKVLFVITRGGMQEIKSKSIQKTKALCLRSYIVKVTKQDNEI